MFLFNKYKNITYLGGLIGGVVGIVVHVTVNGVCFTYNNLPYIFVMLFYYINITKNTYNDI